MRQGRVRQEAWRQRRGRVRRDRSTGCGRREPRDPLPRGRRLRHWEPANGRRSIGPRGEPGHELLHLRSSLPPSRLEDGPVIVVGQVRRQEPHSREVDRARSEQIEDDREAARGPSDLDAVVGLVLGEREDGPAVGEERRVARSQMDIARVELGDMGDEKCRGVAFACGQFLRARHEVVVRKATKGSESVVRHACLYHPRVQDWVRILMQLHRAGAPVTPRAIRIGSGNSGTGPLPHAPLRMTAASRWLS